MNHEHEPRQYDYLALQVERLANAVEALGERLRKVEQSQGNADAVTADRGKRKEPWRETFWKIVYGVAIGIGAWVVKFVMDHTELKH
jgi:hypothetical protein